jgi:hypothetical protein
MPPGPGVGKACRQTEQGRSGKGILRKILGISRTIWRDDGASG